jgi:substrate import-associated zinc metallohydrolase lipoprotein
MKQLKYLLLAAFMACFAACSDDDDFQESILDTTPELRTPLDDWIWDNFTEEYNIRIIYKWKTFEISPELLLVPVEEAKVIPFLEIIQKVWMKPYVQLGGEAFFKETAPKQIALVGSVGYMEDGQYLLGEAERGRRITILGLNILTLDRKQVRQFAHTFHHEYTHILNQLKRYPTTFETISAASYNATTWAQVELGEALRQGFISNYAMSDASEDFAEMAAYFVISNAEEWGHFFDAAGGPGTDAYNKLREKETAVLQYMKNIYGIDMYALRDLVQEELAKVTEEL